MASTPATTADPACCATSVATRVTRSIGPREDVVRVPLLVDRPPAVDVDLAPVALRVDVSLLALRFVLVFERPLALRALLDALAADRPRDVFRFVPDFALREEAPLLAFPRDFLALVAINGLLGVVDEKSTSTIARIRHIRKSKSARLPAKSEGSRQSRVE
jgi:hypothetical protein